MLNYEEGSEREFAQTCGSETSTEWGQYGFPDNYRDLATESIYEYGSRVGVWRILDEIERHETPLTLFACAQAMEANPELATYVRERDIEVCSHGYRWEEAWTLTEVEEADHIRRAIMSIEESTGQRPVGWYCRYGPSERTRRLLVREGGFVYDSDSYADDMPYFVNVEGARHLVIPYTPDNNDFRFWQANGPVTADHFLRYLIDSYEDLYERSENTPYMMSVGLHCRIIGRPGRIRALRGFLDHIADRKDVWVTTRRNIAEAWIERTDG